MLWWQRMLNLADWRIIYDASPTKNLAEMYDWKDEDKLVRFRIGSDFGPHTISEEVLERTAIHECLHVRLHNLMEAVSDYGRDSTEAGKAEHEVIIVLEDLLYNLSDLIRKKNEPA